MRDLIIASNRLPIKVVEAEGETIFKRSDGGLATAVGSLFKHHPGKWVGYLGDNVPARIEDAARERDYYAVKVPAEIYESYYDSFANRVLWPALHNFNTSTDPSATWDEYMAVNIAFANRLAELAQPDSVIWVHDYHLFLVPKLLRQQGITNKIGFFLHTPFYNVPFFNSTPYGQEILESLGECDTVGLQTRRSVKQLRAALKDHPSTGTHIAAFPIGIDFSSFSTKPKLNPAFYEGINRDRDTKLILSLSRLDYTKGLPKQLDAITQLLESGEWWGKFSLQLVVIPSRDQVPEYAALKQVIEDKVGYINDNFGSDDWQPVLYHYDTLDPDELLLTYAAADIMLVTPVADGMNLVAKEYLAANSSGHLILSQEAGAAEQLAEATIVDPHDTNGIAGAIEQALSAPPPLQLNRRLRQIIRTQDVHYWANNFLHSLR